MKRSSTKEAFVTKCHELYDILQDGRQKYDYSEFEYKNNYTSGKIICVEHNISFMQRPDNHLKGYVGCERCPGPKGSKRRADVITWIQKCKELHGELYSYDNIGTPKTSKDAINVHCNTCNNIFETTIDAHLYHKVGCKCIARLAQSQSNYKKEKITSDTNFKGKFPELAKEWDPDNSIKPENIAPFSHKKVKWICTMGCKYEMTIAHRTKGKQNCPICSGRKLDHSNSLANNLDAVKFWHPTKNNKIPRDYTRGSGKWAWFTCDCKNPHEYYMRICNFNSGGERCPYAGGKKFDPEDSLSARYPDIDMFWNTIRNKFSPDDISYGSGIACWLECECGHEWKSTPNSIKNGVLCPACIPAGYSKVAIKWLNSIDGGIKHAENGGEFRIPCTNYRADGYDAATNTIYEFHGTYWHGDPRVYQCDEYNSTTKCTFGELYQKTMKKEAVIKNLGYNLVVMWEYDFV